MIFVSPLTARSAGTPVGEAAPLPAALSGWQKGPSNRRSTRSLRESGRAEPPSLEPGGADLRRGRYSPTLGELVWCSCGRIVMAGSRGSTSLFELLDVKTSSGEGLAPADLRAGTPARRLGNTKGADSAVVGLPDSAELGSGKALSIHGGRLTVSLTSGAAAAVLFLAVALLALAYLGGERVGVGRGEAAGFAKGKSWYEVKVADEIARARLGPVNPSLTQGLAASSTVALPISGDTAQGVERVEVATSRTWVQGNNYVVVQTFKADALQDAEIVKEYMAQNGIETAIISQGNSSHKVITVQGFNLRDSTQKELANRFMTKIRGIGRRFRQAGGRYDFHDCYAMKLSGTSW